ncbi:MAG TPA: quinone oxidoreductase, partial [Acidimicrobiia bacterium]|nr:quinone oxidoreductase [Acidimicrobiia bacterium]
MRAVLVRELGGPETMVVEEIPDPRPGPEDLLVEVEAAGVNFIDIYQRTGLYPLDLPFTPGLEGAGVVIETGEEVEEFVPGDRVGWVAALGTYAERHVVPAEKAIPIPDGVATETVAAVLLQGITAHYLALDTYLLGGRDRCLIHAGAGGVGLLLTQIAKMRGAEVTTTVGSEEKAELSRAAGADHVIVYTQEDFAQAAEERLGPHPFDVVYDGVGAATFTKSLDLLRPRGMMVTFGNASGPPPEISPLLLSQKGSLFLTRPSMFNYMATREELLARTGDLLGWVVDGSLEVRVWGRFTLEEAAQAHRALEGRR